MRKIAVLVVLALAVSAKPADACRAGPCPPWVSAIGWTFAAGLAGGYAYGTGYFIYHDVTDPDQSLGYGVAELTLNGLGAAAFGAGTIDAIRNERWGSAAVLTGFTALHGSLMMHGGWRIYRECDEFRPPPNAALWAAGTAYATNTLIWTAQLDERHGRGYGLAEAAVNGPLAIALGYRAYDRFSNWRGGAGFVYGGMALISGGLAYHGLKTAISPPEPPALDLLGTDIMPTVVTDGIELAPGLGAGGTW